jgi:hypothetical protein
MQPTEYRQKILHKQCTSNKRINELQSMRQNTSEHKRKSNGRNAAIRFGSQAEEMSGEGEEPEATGFFAWSSLLQVTIRTGFSWQASLLQAAKSYWSEHKDKKLPPRSAAKRQQIELLGSNKRLQWSAWLQRSSCSSQIACCQSAFELQAAVKKVRHRRVRSAKLYNSGNCTLHPVC